MKDFDETPKLRENQHIVAQQKQELKMIGSIIVRTGCKLYSFNTESNELKEVVPIKGEGATASMDGKVVVENKKVAHNPKCIYVQAINLKNAKKKINKIINGRHDIVEPMMAPEPKKKNKQFTV